MFLERAKRRGDLVEVYKKQTALFSLLAIISIFIIVGLIFIYSSSSVFALEKFGSAHYFVRKQLIGLGLGLIGLIVFRCLPLNFIKVCTPWVFCAALCLTALTFIPGLGLCVHGSHRWITVAGFGFQPSELLKMAFIMYLAYLLSKKKHRLNSLVHGYIPLLLVVGVTGALLLKQPDFGQTVTLSITSFLLFFLAQCQMLHLLVTLGSAAPVLITLICLRPYRVMRILTFLNPWADPQGAGFQIIQSLIAIGSGNLTGVGIAHSKQKFFYLPMQHTDFIFSIIAEETGFIGSSCLIMLYILFLYCGLKVAQNLKDPFCFYTTAGFVILTALQALVNLFVATGLMPTKGLGLPFISYGNSALLMSLCMIGIIINFAYNDRIQ